MIFAPSHLARIGRKVGTGDVMMRANLGAAQAREEALGLIGARAILRIGVLMIDALREVEAV